MSGAFRFDESLVKVGGRQTGLGTPIGPGFAFIIALVQMELEREVGIRI